MSHADVLTVPMLGELLVIVKVFVTGVRKQLNNDVSMARAKPMPSGGRETLHETDEVAIRVLSQILELHQRTVGGVVTALG